MVRIQKKIPMRIKVLSHSNIENEMFPMAAFDFEISTYCVESNKI